MVVGGWVIHLTLLVLAAVFFFPFVWMFSMSVKTDEEATSTAIFPTIPTYCAASPFVMMPNEVERPRAAPGNSGRSCIPS